MGVCEVRKEKNEHDEKRVFEIGEKSRDAVFHRLYFVHQVLEKAERAEPPACGSSECQADKSDKSDNKIRDLVHRREMLQHADGAGKYRCRAGMAVQNRYAYISQWAAVEHPRPDYRYVAVDQEYSETDLCQAPPFM